MSVYLGVYQLPSYTFFVVASICSFSHADAGSTAFDRSEISLRYKYKERTPLFAESFFPFFQFFSNLILSKLAPACEYFGGRCGWQLLQLPPSSAPWGKKRPQARCSGLKAFAKGIRGGCFKSPPPYPLVRCSILGQVICQGIKNRYSWIGMIKDLLNTGKVFTCSRICSNCIHLTRRMR